ncbi:hypothetical protein C8Q80DRAFT_354238 [Daedaleopsis nitida]|nr:hypothetical protein C8Q80DRAFT_354238 [Daedaleopsis nitida]
MAIPRWNTIRSTLGPLPPELVNQVLQYLLNEKETLSAIAGLNSTWRDLALPYHFSVVKHASATTFDDLFAFLQDCPHLAQHVKSLSLYEKIEYVRYRTKGTQKSLDTVWGGSPTFDCFAFAALLPTMRKLRSLVLENVSLKTTLPTYSLKASPVSSLLQIEVRGDSTVPVLQELQRIIRVDTVTLQDITVEFLKPSPFDKRGAMRFANIVIAESACDVLASLPSGIVLAQLTFLTIKLDDFENLKPLSALLSHAKDGELGGLKKLDLDLSRPIGKFLDTEIPDFSWSLIGSAISACNALQSLRVVLPLCARSSLSYEDILVPSFLDYRNVCFLTGILAKHPLPLTVERINIGFKWLSSYRPKRFESEDDKPFMWDLDVLDNVRAVRMLPFLHPVRVTIEILDMAECHPQDALTINDVVTKALPFVSSAGLLKIEY